MICSDRYYVVRGIVVDGVGEGAKYVKLYLYSIRDRLGLNPYYGTLNIRLYNDEISMVKYLLYNHMNKQIIYPPVEGLSNVFAWKAYIKFSTIRECILVYILKPERTIHGDDIIELISDKYLRRVLGLKNGDEINIILPEDEITPCICL